MPTNCPRCGEGYANTEQHCPRCGEINPRIMAGRSIKKMRMSPGETNTANAASAGTNEAAISSIREQIDAPLQTYTHKKPAATQGKHGKHSNKTAAASTQKATTTVTYADGTVHDHDTTLNMHSEMVALQAAHRDGEYRLLNGSIRACAGYSITKRYFSTDVPHCGFCTVILSSLGMPLDKPTRGNYNFADHDNYPLPDFLRVSALFYANLLCGGTGSRLPALKRLLNHYFKGEWFLVAEGRTVSDRKLIMGKSDNQTVKLLTWESIIAQEEGELLKKLWAYICRCIYQSNRSKK